MRTINQHTEFADRRFEASLFQYIVSCWLADCETEVTAGMIIANFGVIVEPETLDQMFRNLDGLSWGQTGNRRN